MTIKQAQLRLDELALQVGFDAELTLPLGDGWYEEASMEVCFATPVPNTNPKKWRINDESNSIKIVSVF